VTGTGPQDAQAPGVAQSGPGPVDVTCSGCHAHLGQVVRCELAVGHRMPHAAEVDPIGRGRSPERVTWDHDMGMRDAEAAAIRWLRDHGRQR